MLFLQWWSSWWSGKEGHQQSLPWREQAGRCPPGITSGALVPCSSSAWSSCWRHGPRAAEGSGNGQNLAQVENQTFPQAMGEWSNASSVMRGATERCQVICLDQSKGFALCNEIHILAPTSELIVAYRTSVYCWCHEASFSHNYFQPLCLIRWMIYKEWNKWEVDKTKSLGSP